jgi:hypothetical protein
MYISLTELRIVNTMLEEAESHLQGNDLVNLFDVAADRRD